MSCLDAAAQIGSYLGWPQDGLGSALIRICAMKGCPAQRSISRTGSSGSSMARQIEPRHRSCQLLWLSNQWLACQSFNASDIACCDPGTGLHDQLAERHIRVAAGELSFGREVVDTH